MTKELKNKIEAILFTVGKFLTVEEIARLCGFGSTGLVKEVLNELKKDYDSKESALQLQEQDGKWKLNIKKNYMPLTSKLVSETEFDRPTQETLAVIAYMTPVLQSKIIKIRGNKAYEHVKNLREAGLISSEKHSRTRLLKLTPQFYDYFDILKDELMEKLKLEEKAEDKVENVNSENKSAEIK